MVDDVTAESNIPEFSVFGGPLKKLGERLKLVRAGTDSTRFGLALGLSTWSILFIIALLEGTVQRFFSINILAGHIRLLLAIPMFFICEAWVGPRIGEFVGNSMNSGLVPDSERQTLAQTIHRINRMKDSWLVECFLFLIMFVVPLFITIGILPGKSGNAAYIMEQAGGHLTLTNGFYLWFCLPLFRFLLARWLWHLGLWWYFLYRLQKMKLHLIPIHSDGAGGLGYLEVVQEHFAPLAVAFSALLAGSFAEEIISGTLPFESLYYLIPVVLVLNLFFFIGPLLMFSRKLWVCRIKGLDEYMAMAHHYVDAFDQTWIRDITVTGHSQLGTPDIQSLADLTNSVRVIHEMRTVPITRRLIMVFVISTILPFVPFVFIKLNFNELMVRLIQLIAG
jgi:hypothetical protein